jgi:hypothetical protein
VTASVKLSAADSSSTTSKGATIYGLYDKDSNDGYYVSVRADRTISLGKRAGSVDSTIASATVKLPGYVWHTVSMQVSRVAWYHVRAAALYRSPWRHWRRWAPLHLADLTLVFLERAIVRVAHADQAIFQVAEIGHANGLVQ